MTMTRGHVYHLCGSPTSDFFYDLSMIYAKDVCVPDGWSCTFLVVDPKGMWRLGDKVNELSEPQKFKEVLEVIRLGSLIVPHLFCTEGMTLYRTLFEQILGYSLVGSKGSTMDLAADKLRAREIVLAGGVSIAPGGLALRDAEPTIPFPLVVKPNKEDNSKGVTLVYNQSEYRRAYEEAKSFGEFVLVEKYVAGRELRVGLVRVGEEYHMPPVIEYSLDPEYPIRSTKDKLDIDEVGRPTGQSSTSQSATICPAKINEETLIRVKEQAIKAHEALGARHYSLFDFKIEESTGEPIFLEAGLYWSFSPVSMISKMLIAGGESLEKMIDKVWREALVGSS